MAEVETQKPEACQGLYLERNMPKQVRFEADSLVIETQDGRTIYTPLDWFPWLQQATPEQRQNFTLMGSSVYWPLIDEGLSMEVILLGRYGT
jgi:hypothetical protein